MSKTLVIIPARGGSKGIPKKNVATLNGRPLIAYSIEEAKQLRVDTSVYVSTDDEEIGNIALKEGADEFIWRPDSISGDEASSESALIHALGNYKTNFGSDPDYVVFLQATSPIRPEGGLKKALDKLIKSDGDSLFSCSKMEGFVWRFQGDTIQSLTYDYQNRPRRQEAPEDVIENGSFYIFKPWVLRENNNRLGGKIVPYEIPPFYSFQIDEPEDLDLMEKLMAIEQNQDKDQTNNEALKAIKLLVLDFDGVLTDNHVYINEDGIEAVKCDRGDGMGLERLRKLTDVEVFILSKESNPVVQKRSEKLNIPVIHDCDDKLTTLQRLAGDKEYKVQEIAYFGNDLNDLECMNWVAQGIAVQNAEEQVKQAASKVMQEKGGEGAVRRLCEAIIDAKNT